MTYIYAETFVSGDSVTGVTLRLTLRAGVRLTLLCSRLHQGSRVDVVGMCSY